MEVNTVDTSQGQTSDNQSSEGQSQDTQQSQSQPSTPWFDGGKHKFKINGVEREITREEAERLIPLSAGAYSKFEEASALRKQVLAEQARVKKIEQQLVEYARSNAHLFGGQSKERSQGDQSPDQTQAADPREYELVQLRDELKSLKEGLQSEKEQAEIMSTKQEIAKELEGAKAKFPRFSTKYGEALLKAQYKQHLERLADDEEPLSMEEVAFAINSELEEDERKASQAKVAKLEENRKRAPVSAPTTGARTAPVSTNTTDMFTEIRRKAGLI